MVQGLLGRGDTVVPLRRIQAVGDITDDFGLFTLRQEYENDTNQTMDVHYTFPLADCAAIVDFFATIGDQRVQGELMDREQALELFQNNSFAVLLRQYHSGMFRTELGGLPPGQKAAVTIQFLQKYEKQQECCRILFPTVVAPRWGGVAQWLSAETPQGSQSYALDLDVTIHGTDITNVTSPSHNIVVAPGEHITTVQLREPAAPDGDVILDVYRLPAPQAQLFCKGDLFDCTFQPQLGDEQRLPRDFQFLLNLSASMTGEKLEQAKTALLVCLRSLQQGDRFRITVVDPQNNTFCDEFLPLTEDCLRTVTRWVLGLEPRGGTELLPALMGACRQSPTATILLFTDGQIMGEEEVLSYLKLHRQITCYTFGIDTAVNQSFLARLAHATGGLAYFVAPGERIDDTIISAFATIAAPGLEQVTLSFNTPVEGIAPKEIPRIHRGQQCSVLAKAILAKPTELLVKGWYCGRLFEQTIPLSPPTQAGEALYYWYGKSRLVQLEQQLMGDQSPGDKMIKQQMRELSLQYQVCCSETALLIVSGTGKSCTTVDVHVPLELPAGWYQPVALSLGEATDHTLTERKIVAAMATQHANGSFLPRGEAWTMEQIAAHTADILLQCVRDCPTADFYRLQLKKAAGYVLFALSQGDYAQIPPQMLEALFAWHKIYGGTDEISQKVEALHFLHGGI